jgi:anti-sigma-K factor RsiG
MKAMEPLPDLASLADQELRELIEELERQESDISYQRRVLQGRIDILRAERTARLRKSVGAGQSPLADMDTLTDILSQKGAPSNKDPAA